MANNFDSLQANANGIVNKTMGYDGAWTPSVGGLPELTGRILLKEPTEKDLLNGVEYTPFTYHIEYFIGNFAGLLEASRSGLNEVINVEGSLYDVRIVAAKYDGKSLIAISEKQS